MQLIFNYSRFTPRVRTKAQVQLNWNDTMKTTGDRHYIKIYISVEGPIKYSLHTIFIQLVAAFNIEHRDGTAKIRNKGRRKPRL